MSKSNLLRSVELTLSPSQLHTACRKSFQYLHHSRLSEACETQVESGDLNGVSSCNGVVFWAPPGLEHGYDLSARGTQLVESWLVGVLLCAS